MTAAPMWNRLRTPIVFIAALAAGAGARASGLPAAWLVGPMLAAAAFGLGPGWRVAVPVQAYRAAQAVMGMAISASFQPGAVGEVVAHWPVVVITSLVVLLLSLLGGAWLARSGRLDPATAMLGTMSGGASGMVAMSDDLGADPRLVAFMQYARLSLVMTTASLVAAWADGTPGAPAGPAAGAGGGAGWTAYGLTAVAAGAGAWLGERLRLPAGSLVGPVVAGLVLGALGLPHGVWPPGALPAAYLVLGVGVGSRYDRATLQALRRAAPAVVAFVVLLMAAGALVAWALVAWAGLDWLTAYLATAPGGIESATAAALDAGADTPLVVTVHVVRILVVILAGPPLVRLVLRGRRAAPGSRGYVRAAG